MRVHRSVAVAILLGSTLVGCASATGESTTTIRPPSPSSQTGRSIGEYLRALSPPDVLQLSDVRSTACCVEAGFVLIGGYQTGSFDLDTAGPVLDWVESLGTSFRFTCSVRELVDDPDSCAAMFPPFASDTGSVTVFGEIADSEQQADAELWVTRSKDATFSVYLALWAEMS